MTRDSRQIGVPSAHRPGAPAGEAAGQPAFSLTGPDPSPIPVLIAVPHAGRDYTPALLARMRAPRRAALRLEDRHVDRLAARVARATGATLLVAHAPRAMIDLNRAPDDVDWEMIEPGANPRRASSAPRQRARTGLGLIPRRLSGLGELWTARLPDAELAARVAEIHAPYHACLGAALARLRARWGAALLLDLHSMPPLAGRGDAPAAELVVGDRFGASCSGGLVAACFAAIAREGRRAAHNRPYAGGYGLDRHADPARGIHALQLEVDRACYLDVALAEEGPGFAAMAATLAVVVRQLAAHVAGLAARDSAEAAE